MRLCHGQGNLDTGGCCWVNGERCPLRIKIENGRVLEGTNREDKGTVAQYINAKFTGGPRRTRATEQLQGAVYACRAALEVIANDSTLLNDRAAFNAAWNNHADYLALVRPAWVALEQQLGLPEGSYQCSTWQGTGRDECCFAEDDPSNESKRGGLSSVAVQIRSAGGKS